MPLLVLFDQAIVSGGNFMTTVLLGRHAGEEALGVYRMGMSVVVMMISLPMSLVWTPYNVYSAQMSIRRRAAYQWSMCVHIVGVAVVAAAALLAASIFAGSDWRLLFWSLAAIVVALLLREHARRMCFARMDAREAVVLDATVTALQLAGLVALIALGWLTGERAFLVIGAACVVGLALFPQLIAARRPVRASGSRTLVDFRRNWRMSKYLFAGALMYSCSNGAYPWLLGLLHGEAAVGRLAAAEGAIFLANPLLIAATNYFGPAMAHTLKDRGVEGLHQQVVRCTAGLAAVMLIFTGVMYLVGGQFVALVYGAKFDKLGAVVVALCFAQVVTAALIPLRSGLLALDEGRLMVIGGVIRLVSLVAVGIVAVQSWGPIGVAVGMLCGDLAAMSVLLFCLKSQLRRRLAASPAS